MTTLEQDNQRIVDRGRIRRMVRERLTRDLCQDCWQDRHPGEYFPNVTRYGECDEHGGGGLWLVARSRIADEEVPA